LEGLRGLRGGSSLPRLLAEHRGVRNRRALPPLTEAQIARWARSHFKRTGKWPNDKCGQVIDAPGETWKDLDRCLRHGVRGLPSGDTLGRFIARRFGVRNRTNIPPLSVEQILVWADAHHARTGRWPRVKSGAIDRAPGETWENADQALRSGCRGLRGGSSLPRLLTERRGARNTTRPPPLDLRRIVAWAKAHLRRTGRWPTCESGPIADAPGETWGAVQVALNLGYRGFPGGSSLARLLDPHRNGRWRRPRKSKTS
jgi:hypothetical protein